MKTIDEIINNKEYEHLNGALLERSIELAQKIREAMNIAEVTEIGDYSIRTVKTRSGFSDTSLYIFVVIPDGYGYKDYYYHNLELRRSEHYAGDYNCWIEAATGKDRIQFLNTAREILDEIEQIKQQRITDIKSALNATKDL